MSQTTFTLLAVLFGVISSAYTAASYLWDRNSHTHFKVGSADGDFIYVKVWNTGRKPSRLIDYHLNLDKLPVKTQKVPDKDGVDLTLSTPDEAEANSVIAPGGPSTIHLTLDDVLIPSGKLGTAVSYTKPEIMGMLSKHLLTLDIKVEESNDPSFFGRKCHKYSDGFPADHVARFFDGRIP